MTKVDIISGFLGAGKTTFIKKLINDVYQGQQIVLIENEFGEIGIDGTFMNNAGIEVTEINSGCICCSLVGDFEASLKEVLETYHPDRIIIEPSGVGKLSDVIKAVGDVNSDELELDNYIAVIDAKKCRLYTKNFGEFFNNQIEYASLIILSRTQNVTEYQLDECIKIIKDHNDKANIITTPWDQLTKETLVNAFSDSDNLRDELLAELDVCPECGHHHEHHHDHDCDCEHHEHHHDHDCDCEHHEHHHDHDCDCEHHEHHHDHDCDCKHHEHHHDHDCGCGHHHHHHHADEVFTSWGKQTPKKYTKEQLEAILKELSSDNSFGNILRAKGYVDSNEDKWWYFDLVPGEYEIRTGNADFTGRICVIGEKLDEAKLDALFEGVA
ncbi:GTP-binding protein [uncultured Thomasclavelia sp.]|uniref:GTP-binding protein n=1 Tax=uncultured Thomasclavelia sp. TaxID=3025759 RepID=UPI002602BACC|nr:GTP-binding protein [uncultured Thomasclavelia sp.]